MECCGDVFATALEGLAGPAVGFLLAHGRPIRQLGHGRPSYSLSSFSGLPNTTEMCAPILTCAMLIARLALGLRGPA